MCRCDAIRVAATRGCSSAIRSSSSILRGKGVPAVIFRALAIVSTRILVVLIVALPLTVVDHVKAGPAGCVAVRGGCSFLPRLLLHLVSHDIEVPMSVLYLLPATVDIGCTLVDVVAVVTAVAGLPSFDLSAAQLVERQVSVFADASAVLSPNNYGGISIYLR